MRRWALVLLFLAGCTSTVTISPAATEGSPGAAPPASSGNGPVTPTGPPSNVLAVIVGPDSLSLVRSDGSIQATVPLDPPPFFPHHSMSRTSASTSRVYYLNRGSEVRSLGPDGKIGSVTRIPLGATEQAGFAVTPDDTRIAVAIFSYVPAPANPQGVNAPSYTGMRLYVEDLQGGGHHVDIFSSPTVSEFPIGWIGGRLILAVGDPFCCQSLTLNPYAASSYHLVDPATGTRLASICDKSVGPMGPVEPFGAVCQEIGAAPLFQHWDGSQFSPPAAVPSPQYLVALSPDGSQVAVGGDRIRIMGPGATPDKLLAESGYVYGWLDPGHVVFSPLVGEGFAFADVNADVSQKGPPRGTYVGTFPAALG